MRFGVVIHTQYAYQLPSQPCLVTSAVASASLIVSFSTPVDKAKLAKIRDLYLGNGLIIGRQISPGSQTSMAL